MKLVQLVASLTCIRAAEASCQGEQCAGGAVSEEDSDAGALLQVRAVASTDDAQRYSTRPSDIAALTALWEANGKQSTMVGWGVGDPCYGEAPPGQANAQGFGPWKGVACVPCPEPEDSLYLCVSQTWLHQKNLNGTIPEAFTGLTELRWLFLSANNLTGPLPKKNWATFKKLVRLDLSYNNINGTLNLNKMMGMPVERMYFNDNRLDRLHYTGGGFESLETLDINYNRNLTSEFPVAFAELPALATLEIHDTNITSTVPLPDGPWPALENLIITGTGGLCGPLPTICDKAFCDVIYAFPDCGATPAPTPMPKQKLIFGTPLSGYHNVTVWVYEQAMVKLGYEVQVISKYQHPILYPMFIGKGGLEDDTCEEEGCAEKCREEGFDASPCIDFVVDSNIPVNHATWLEAYTDQFNVIGTAFRDQAIGLYAPDYTGWTTLSDAVGPPRLETREVYAWKSGPGDGCDTLYCPKCGSTPYLSGPPLASPENEVNWTYVDYSCQEFEDRVAANLNEKRWFLVQMWNPQVFRVRFPTLVALNMEQYTPRLEPNHGKALIRGDRRDKLDVAGISVLGAIFLGDDDVARMDAWSHGIDLPAGYSGQLCDYESWNNGCAKEAALLWIKLNSNNGETKGVWEMFFW